MGLLPVCNSTCFSSTFYTNYFAISLRVAWVNACRRLVFLKNGLEPQLIYAFSVVRRGWDKHFSHNSIYFWKIEYQICCHGLYLNNIASLLRHCGKFVCMKRYHCSHLSPDYPFLGFKWDYISCGISNCHYVTCICALVHPELHTKEAKFISAREDYENTIWKVDQIKFSRKIGQDNSVQKNYTMSCCFLLKWKTW